MIRHPFHNLFTCIITLGFVAQASIAAPARPNILLIVSEDNGPELGCYGDQFAQTPTLDQLAREGVRFENAYVPYPVCSPSRGIYLTGLYPFQNGQIGLATHKFAMYKNHPTAFSHLKGAGYTTGLIGKLHVNPESAFHFDFRKIPGNGFRKGQRDMKKYATAAAEFFNSAGDRPFFLSINYPDAHFPLHRQDHGLPKKPLTGADVKPLPWIGVDSPRLREFTADYYNCLSRLDTGVEMLLSELKKSGKANNTLIIYIGDHGAQFSRGKFSVYEAGLRIPMITHWAGQVKPGTVVPQLTSTIDILPTILHAAGIAIPENLPGNPLQNLMNGGNDGGHKYIFGMTTGACPSFHHIQFSIRDNRYRLVHTPVPGIENRFAKAYLTQFNKHMAGGTMPSEIASARPEIQKAYQIYLVPPKYELYDLDSDPSEFLNIADNPEYAVIKMRLIVALAEFQKNMHDPLADPALLKAFDDRQKNADKSYKKTRGFRWPYVDEFSAWIKKRAPMPDQSAP